MGRRDAVIAEMRLGPVWKIRNAVVAQDASQTDADEQVAATTQSTVASSKALDVAHMGWTELAATVASCQVCGLCRGRVKTVFGVGDEQAPYLFVGEGPGYHENQQGEPFVGVAGQLLDNMLRSLGLSRSQKAYIANIVKCRPTDARGNDRPPTVEEIAACFPYLQRQIELIQPAVIVALGKTAAVSLLGLDSETAVGKLRGQTFDYCGIPVIVTYHPAYLLRQPLDKSKAWQDLCRLPDIT